jgi:hypothetical protein
MKLSSRTKTKNVQNLNENPIENEEKKQKAIKKFYFRALSYFYNFLKIFKFGRNQFSTQNLITVFLSPWGWCTLSQVGRYCSLPGLEPESIRSITLYF